MSNVELIASRQTRSSLKRRRRGLFAVCSFESFLLRGWRSESAGDLSWKLVFPWRLVLSPSNQPLPLLVKPQLSGKLEECSQGKRTAYFGAGLRNTHCK